MPGVVTTDMGKITISDEILATIAGMVTVENAGVIGMAARSGDFWELLKRDSVKKGVRVAVADDAVNADLYIMVEYGVAIAAVAQNIISNVTYRLKEYTGLNVSFVNVHVEGVRVNNA